MTKLSKIAEAIKQHVKGKPLTKTGAEIPDPVPMAPPIGYKKQPTMVDHIRTMIRSEKLRQEVEAAGFETMEEADDFDIGDDVDPASPYEHNFDPPQYGPGPEQLSTVAPYPPKATETGLEAAAASGGKQTPPAPPPPAPPPLVKS